MPARLPHSQQPSALPRRGTLFNARVAGVLCGGNPSAAVPFPAVPVPAETELLPPCRENGRDLWACGEAREGTAVTRRDGTLAAAGTLADCEATHLDALSQESPCPGSATLFLAAASKVHLKAWDAQWIGRVFRRCCCQPLCPILPVPHQLAVQSLRAARTTNPLSVRVRVGRPFGQLHGLPARVMQNAEMALKTESALGGKRENRTKTSDPGAGDNLVSGGVLNALNVNVGATDRNPKRQADHCVSANADGLNAPLSQCPMPAHHLFDPTTRSSS